jgi:hypothetical protein
MKRIGGSLSLKRSVGLVDSKGSVGSLYLKKSGVDSRGSVGLVINVVTN